MNILPNKTYEGRRLQELMMMHQQGDNMVVLYQNTSLPDDSMATYICQFIGKLTMVEPNRGTINIDNGYCNRDSLDEHDNSVYDNKRIVGRMNLSLLEDGSLVTGHTIVTTTVGEPMILLSSLLQSFSIHHLKKVK